MITNEHLLQKLDALHLSAREQQEAMVKSLALLVEASRPRQPIDMTIQVNDTVGWPIDYRDRKHVFIWLPSSSLTLVFDDYGTGVVPAQVWVNLGIQEGVRLFTSGQGATFTMIK